MLGTMSLSIKDRCQIMNLKGIALHAQWKLADALATDNAIIELPKPDSLRYFDIRAYISMNDIFTEIGMIEAAGTALDKAQETMSLSNQFQHDQLKRVSTMLGISRSILSMKKGDYIKALSLWQVAEQYSNATPSLRLIWLGHGIDLHRQLGKHQRANSLSDEALALNERNPNLLTVLIDRMEYCNSIRDYNKALSLLDKFSHLKVFTTDKNLQRRLFVAHAEALHGLGHEESSEFYRLAVQSTDSLYEEQLNVLRSVVASQITPSAYSALKRSMANLQKQESMSILALGIVGAAAISGLWFIGYRRRKEKLKLRGEVLRASDAESKAKKLQIELDDANMALCARSLHDDKITAALTCIRQELIGDKSREDKLRSIRFATNEIAHATRDSDDFIFRFSRENRNLVARLLQLCPNLSQNELSVAQLIVAGVATKDIAFRLNRSVRTVEGIKYALRKKLRIEGATSEYLRSLFTEVQTSYKSDAAEHEDPKNHRQMN